MASKPVSVTVSIIIKVDFPPVPISFDTVCYNPADTYRAVMAAMKTNRVMFPDVTASQSEYMRVIVDMFEGKTSMFKPGCETFVIRRND